jgi:hypothetical protein
MEARTVGWSIAVAVVATFGFVAMFAIEAETSSRDLAKAQNDRNEAQDDLDKTRNAVDRALERVKQATKFSVAKDKANAELTQLQKEIHSVNEKVTAETKTWNDERDAFEKTLNAVRKATVRTKVKDVNINGVVHDNVTITAVNQGMVSIETDSGIQKLNTAKLPADLAEKLKPDWSPVLKVTASLLPKETPKPLAKDDTPEPDRRYPQEDSTPPPAAPAELPAPPPPAGGKENPVTTEITKHRNAMNTLAVNMRTAEMTLADRRATCARLESEYNSARIRSKIVTLPPELVQARKSVETIMAQFEIARKQYATMVLKMNELAQREADWFKANP